MFPTEAVLKMPLLVLLASKGPMRAGETYRPIADFVGLTEDAREELRPDATRGRKWNSCVGWVREKLKRDGLLDAEAPRGIWQLTVAGQAEGERLAQTPFFIGHPGRHHLGLSSHR